MLIAFDEVLHLGKCEWFDILHAECHRLAACPMLHSAVSGSSSIEQFFRLHCNRD
jgi:hypothetical protein